MLKLGQFNFGQRLPKIDESDFVALRHLHLTRWVFGPELQYTDAEEPLLLAPRLEQFTWDFGILCHDYMEPLPRDFGDPEEEWLRALMKTALIKHVPLRRVHIKFTLEDPCFTEEGDVYPWDRMDALAVEFAPHGIIVTYDEPIYSKDTWIEMYEDDRAQGR